MKLVKGVNRVVYIFLADGFEEIEAIAVIDILRRAGVTVKSVSITDTLQVKAAHDITLMADITLTDVDLKAADMVILPGGMPGTRHLAGCAPLIDLLKEAYDNGLYVAAICAAPTVLAKAGLLKGKRAICYPGFEGELEGAIITDELVVKDGKIITSKGPGTAMHFGYALVDILKGNLESDTLRSGMIFDWWT